MAGYRGMGEEPHHSQRSELADGLASEDPEFDSTNINPRFTRLVVAHRLAELPMAAAAADAREFDRLQRLPPRF
jgi:hypothetical protein